MPRSRCQGCGFVQFKEEFAPQQWTKKNKRRFCKTCVAKYKAEGTPLECTMCCRWEPEDAFAERYRKPNSINTRVCNNCIERRVCRGCGDAKIFTDFSPGEWEHAAYQASEQGKCRDCIKYNRQTKPCSKCKRNGKVPYKFMYEGNFSKNQWETCDEERLCIRCAKPQSRIGWWKCVQCKVEKEKKNFAKWRATRKNDRKDHTSRCNTCFEQQRQEEKSMSEASHATFQKLSRK